MTTLILLPGMDGTGTLFDNFIESLENEFIIKTVRYPSTVELDYNELASLVIQNLPERGNFVILGESFSGPVAISLAATKHPRLIGLILCCTFACNPRPLLSFFQRIIDYIPLHSMPTFFLSFLLHGKCSTYSLRRSLSMALSQVSESVLRSRLKSILSVNEKAKINTINIPVLILRGQRDWVVPKSACTHFSACMPHSKVVSFNSPHLLLQTFPAESARVVGSFIRTIQKAQ